ncbi:MAG: TonB-dependent receptor [Ignavibacteriaceae bacterium]|nr:TonB-dependent receptor [Ignavibacteriaceae bacterium]
MFKYNYIFLTLIFFSVFSITQFRAQQKGTISGKITDKTTNEDLIGANVIVVGTPLGAASDIDGTYLIRNLPEGTYSIKISYVSYQSMNIENVRVVAGKETKVDISLSPISTELEEVVITAEALKNSEAGILKMQRNSLNIVDGLSSELIKKNNNSTGIDVLKSMTGVTISDGKFAVIRGIGDRYNNTMLNGANLPSTDPEKKSFSYDIFPASLIENVMTAKTFTPDKPADFSGGLVQIQTLEFPQKFFFDLNFSGGYDRENNLSKFMTYSGSKSDHLGFDAGDRQIPSAIGDLRLSNALKDSVLQFYGKTFKNNWGTSKTESPFNGSFKLSLGDKYDLEEAGLIGVVGSLSYSSSFDVRNLEKNNYDYQGTKYEYDGEIYSRTVTWGALVNLSYKFLGTNKISFKNIYNQDGEDVTSFYKGEDYYGGQYRENTGLRFVSRSLISHQLLGAHFFDLLYGVNFEWNASYSKSKRDEPDARNYSYRNSVDEPGDPLRFQLDPSIATRFYGKLDDVIYGFNTDFTVKPFESPTMPKFKFGFLLDKKEREFDARSFGFKNLPFGDFFYEDTVLMGPVDKIFVPEHFTNTFIQIQELTKPSDSYDTRQDIFGTYLMFDFDVLAELKLIGGVRMEQSKQVLQSRSITGSPVNVVKENTDYLPSLNLTYRLTENSNIRAAFTQTLARPEFRELAPYSYYDFVANELVMGDTSLERTLINNYDLRFETYPGPGELAAVSLFYKKFEKPIEQILIVASYDPIRSFTNAKEAVNYGVEFELRKSLRFIHSWVEKFSIVGNLSFIKSEIKLTDDASTSTFQASKRPLQGQADFILNTGIYYDDYDNDLSASLVYNKVGDRIAKVGYAGLGDVIEKAREVVDLSVSKKLFDMLSVKLLVRDMFAQDYRFIQKTPLGEKVAERYKTASQYSVSLTYQF